MVKVDLKDVHRQTLMDIIFIIKFLYLLSNPRHLHN